MFSYMNIQNIIGRYCYWARMFVLNTVTRWQHCCRLQVFLESQQTLITKGISRMGHATPFPLSHFEWVKPRHVTRNLFCPTVWNLIHRRNGELSFWAKQCFYHYKHFFAGEQTSTFSVMVYFNQNSVLHRSTTYNSVVK